MIFEPYAEKLDKNLIDKLISTIDNINTQLSKEYEEEIALYLKPLTLKVIFSNFGKASYLVENIMVLQKGYPFELESYTGPWRSFIGYSHNYPQDITDKVQLSRPAPFLVPADQDISILIEFPEPYTRWFIENQISSRGNPIDLSPSIEHPQDSNAKDIQLFQNRLETLLEQYGYEIRAVLANGLIISRSINAKESFSKRNLFQF